MTHPLLRTYYLYSDEGLLAESQQFIQSNADGSVTALNTPAISSQYGPVPDAPFSTGILFIKTRDQNGNDLVAYYQHNHLQAPLQAIDKQGNIRWAAQYTAFGQTSIISSGDSAINSNLRLPGQYADSESGLYYNWQRYYDANTGRYISSDPIGLAGGFNRYAYVGGNPVGWVDPSGEIGFAGAIIGGISGAYGAFIQGGCAGDILIGLGVGAATGFIGGGVAGAFGKHIGGKTALGLGGIFGSAVGAVGNAAGQLITGGVGSLNVGAIVGAALGGIYGGVYGAVRNAGIGADIAGAGIGLTSELIGGKLGKSVDESLGHKKQKCECGPLW